MGQLVLQEDSQLLHKTLKDPLRKEYNDSRVQVSRAKIKKQWGFEYSLGPKMQGDPFNLALFFRLPRGHNCSIYCKRCLGWVISPGLIEKSPYSNRWRN